MSYTRIQDIDHSTVDNETISTSILTPVQAEQIIERFNKIPLVEIGSKKWIQQHSAFTRLNLQAHYNATHNTDPFILEALITFNKMEVLVHELLAAEMWTRNIFPWTKQKMAERNPTRAYFAMYQQGLLANLLETLLYHESAAEALGDALIDVTDWCMRQIAFLIHRGNKNKNVLVEENTTNQADTTNSTSSSFQLSEHTLSLMTPEQRERAKEIMESAGQASSSSTDHSTSNALNTIESQADHIAFTTAIAAVSVLRYLSEHCPKLSLSLRTRLLNTHDVPLAMVSLIENPPWTRHMKNGKWQKLIQLQWKEVQPRDLLKLTALEAQPWLTLYNLLCDPETMRRYEMHSYRRGTLLRVRKYMHEILLDQIPNLTDLQRLFDEMSVTNAAPPSVYGTAAESVPSAFVLELQPEIYDQVIKASHEEGERIDIRPGSDFVKQAATRLNMTVDQVNSQLNGSHINENQPQSNFTQSDAMYKWLKAAIACFEHGFKNKDAGDQSLLVLADVFQSDAFAQLDELAAQLPEHEDTDHLKMKSNKQNLIEEL